MEKNKSNKKICYIVLMIIAITCGLSIFTVNMLNNKKINNYLESIAKSNKIKNKNYYHRIINGEHIILEDKGNYVKEIYNIKKPITFFGEYNNKIYYSDTIRDSLQKIDGKDYEMNEDTKIYYVDLNTMEESTVIENKDLINVFLDKMNISLDISDVADIDYTENTIINNKLYLSICIMKNGEFIKNIISLNLDNPKELEIELKNINIIDDANLFIFDKESDKIIFNNSDKHSFKNQKIYQYDVNTKQQMEIVKLNDSVAQIDYENGILVYVETNERGNYELKMYNTLTKRKNTIKKFKSNENKYPQRIISYKMIENGNIYYTEDNNKLFKYNVYTDKREELLGINVKFDYYYIYNNSFVFINRKKLCESEQECGGTVITKGKSIDINSDEYKTKLVKLNGKIEMIAGLGRIDRKRYEKQINHWSYAYSNHIINGN